MPAAEPKTADPVDHSAMDPGTMDHGAMDHSSPSTPAEGSGTARLPANEGGHTGLHIDAGNDWMVMTHGASLPISRGRAATTRPMSSRC